MNSWIKTAALGLLVFGLVGCASEPAEAPAEEAMTEESEMAEEAPTAAATTDAEADCLVAVAEEVGVDAGMLSVISAEMGETSTAVMVEVPEAQAPWQCNWGYVDGEPGALEVFYTAEG